MMTFLTFLSIFSFFILSKSKSPVKMILFLLSGSSFMLVGCYESGSDLWVLLIISLLLIGGIIVSLMILSSIDLNQKISFNFLTMMILLFALGSLMVSFNFFSSSQILDMGQSSCNLMKWGFSDSLYFMTLTMFMLLYFFSFIVVLQKNSFSLRKSL